MFINTVVRNVKMDKIYLDNAATTKVDSKVVEAMKPYFDLKYGNASSLHSFGQEAKKALEDSREVIAGALNARAKEIVFTSGGTESNNFAIKGTSFANKEKGNHIIVSKVEHDCVLESCKWLEKQGFEVSYIDVDKEGFVKIDELEKAIRDDTILVSVIHGNNEVGTINDLEKIGEVCKAKKVYFHTDACQSFTKVPIDVKEINIDLITVNSHKIHGPKGVGALFIKKGTRIEAWQHGGGHENRKRSGTENIPGIVGFAKAVEVADKAEYDKVAELRDKFIARVEKEIPKVTLNGLRQNRLQNNANLMFKGIEGEGLLIKLDDAGIKASTGSACSSKSLEPSHVLLALGIDAADAHGSIRFSFSKYNTSEEVDYTVGKLKEKVAELRSISPLWEGDNDV